MTPGFIQGPLPLKPLVRVSPSRYALFRACPLREIWSVDSTTTLLPRNPMTILGLIAHQLLQEASWKPESGDFDAERVWDRLVQNANQELQKSWLEERLYPLQSTAPMYEVLRARTCRRARGIEPIAATRRSGKATRRASTGYEIWVESRDRTVGGWIDTAERIDGQIVLSDLKAGEFLEQPERGRAATLKEAYGVQLKIYAALYQETFGEWPTKIQIMPLTGAARVIPFREEECTTLLAEASRTLKDINAKVSNGQGTDRDFAAPAAPVCRFCGFRPSCRAYQAAPKKKIEKWPVDAFGQVWDISVLRDGKINLRVSIDSGEDVILRALSPARHPGLKTIQRGERVGIFNARLAGGNREFAEGIVTVLYKFAGSFMTGR